MSVFGRRAGLRHTDLGGSHPRWVPSATPSRQPKADPATGEKSKRLAKVLQNYDTAELEAQQEALRAYNAARISRTVRRKAAVSQPPPPVEKVAAPLPVATASFADRFLPPDPVTGMIKPNVGLYGGGKVRWWALWCPIGREKQLVDAINRILPSLPPLNTGIEGEGDGAETAAREVQSWVPTKKVKAWNPKTNKVGTKTLKYDGGGWVFVKAVMDNHFAELLTSQINFLGFRDREMYEEVAYPRPASKEFMEEVRAWEKDLTELSEAQVREDLGLPPPQPKAVSAEDDYEAYGLPPPRQREPYTRDARDRAPYGQERERGGGRFASSGARGGGRFGGERGPGGAGFYRSEEEPSWDARREPREQRRGSDQRDGAGGRGRGSGRDTLSGSDWSGSKSREWDAPQGDGWYTGPAGASADDALFGDSPAAAGGGGGAAAGDDDGGWFSDPSPSAVPSFVEERTVPAARSSPAPAGDDWFSAAPARGGLLSDDDFSGWVDDYDVTPDAPGAGGGDTAPAAPQDDMAAAWDTAAAASSDAFAGYTNGSVSGWKANVVPSREEKRWEDRGRDNDRGRDRNSGRSYEGRRDNDNRQFGEASGGGSSFGSSWDDSRDRGGRGGREQRDRGGRRDRESGGGRGRRGDFGGDSDGASHRAPAPLMDELSWWDSPSGSGNSGGSKDAAAPKDEGGVKKQDDGWFDGGKDDDGWFSGGD